MENGFEPGNGSSGGIPPIDYFYERENEKHGLRRLSKFAGGAVLGFLFILYAVSFLLMATGLYYSYESNLIFQNVLNSVMTFVAIFIPFLIVLLAFPRERRRSVLCMGSPRSVPLFIAALPIGLAACLLGNYATDWFVMIMQAAGVTLTAPETQLPSGLGGIFAYSVTTAIVPAIVEEFAMRSVTMQPLRRYGDRFAIVMSSLVFAIMHRNLVQAPFAFISGIAIGWLVIATGTVRTGICIHFLNNLFYVVMRYGGRYYPNSIEKFYLIFSFVTFAVAAVSLIFFSRSSARVRLRRSRGVLTARQRTACYIFTVPMLFALAILVYVTAQYVAV